MRDSVSRVGRTACEQVLQREHINSLDVARFFQGTEHAVQMSTLPPLPFPTSPIVFLFYFWIK